MKTDKTDSASLPETRGRKSQSAYPWETMKVNDTFFWGEPWSEEESTKANSRIQYYQNSPKLKEQGRKFSMRKVETETGTMIKIYRVA
jgi:hypothetical protein